MPARRRQSMLAPNTFSFLNATSTLDECGWNSPGHDKLWLYNLHYFDDLNAEGAGARTQWHQALIERWIADNPPARGSGWESYPVSLRIVNWIKWSHGGNPLPLEGVASLAIQALWLSGRIEWHLLGNHVFANAKALVYAGLFFEGVHARSWLAKGLSIIGEQLSEQVLADGGNFERSTMYHAIFLEDVLDLINISRAYPGRVPTAVVQTWIDTSMRMLRWAEGMLHPDGQIALFNDAAFNVAPEPDQLFSYAARLGIKWQAPQPHLGTDGLLMSCWPDSGYIRMSSAASVVLLDVAPVGPDYLPGHAHADTLSFEMSVFGQRVVVNGGTSCYGVSSTRSLERKTISHSTVEVAGQDSSEVWSGFRVARRAYPFDLRRTEARHALTVGCSHDGYRGLAGRPIHRREWKMETGTFSVRDTVTGGRHTAVARYITHPDVRLTFDTVKNSGQLVLPDGRSISATVLAGRGFIEPAAYAPEFGMIRPTQCLVLKLENGEGEIRWSWAAA